jgi:hypothetical protein
MLVEQLFPQVIGGRKSLGECLIEAARSRGIEADLAASIVARVPVALIASECFLDKMTGLWRYEFGLPYDTTRHLVWGSHMWVPVKDLITALYCAHTRLPDDKLNAYLTRLGDPESHQAVLVEMIPADKIAVTTAMDFEVGGLGVGNRTIDWLIHAEPGRIVLVDVKRRSTDFIIQMEAMGTGGKIEPPSHQVSLLFRSVEQKFLSADPNSRLQGVWIVTDIKQEESELMQAFNLLDADRVHFAVFGDWEQDIHVLARRANDQNFLLDLFRAEPSTRFVFSRATSAQGQGP